MGSPYALMLDIAACIKAQFEADGLPEPCYLGVLPGDAVAHDYRGTCEGLDGQVWVRLGAAYPATTVGQLDETAGNCGKSLGLDIEIGSIRSAPYPDDDGNPPSEAEQAAATEQQIKDMVTIKKALKCCMPLKGSDHILGPYQPVGPQGGVVGGVWLLSVTL